MGLNLVLERYPLQILYVSFSASSINFDIAFECGHEGRYSVREQFSRRKRGMTLSAGSLASFQTGVDLSEGEVFKGGQQREV